LTRPVLLKQASGRVRRMYECDVLRPGTCYTHTATASVGATLAEMGEQAIEPRPSFHQDKVLPVGRLSCLHFFLKP